MKDLIFPPLAASVLFAASLFAADSFDKYKAAAERGDAPAQAVLGACYQRGLLVKADAKKAVYWYRKAAEQGHTPAQFELGECYANGSGVEKNLTEAFKWYEKSSKQGYRAAKGAIARCYEEGLGVEKDLEKAKCLFSLLRLAEGGCMRVEPILGKHATEWFKWHNSLAELGDAMSQYYVGYAYEDGYGTDFDDEKAKYWLKKSADQGDKAAKDLLRFLEFAQANAAGARRKSAR